MVELKEYKYKILDVDRIFHVLGGEKIAENVVDWCKRHPGEIRHKVTPHGLRLTTIAGKEPMVTLSLDAQQAKKFFTGLGPTDMLVIKTYGVYFAGPNNSESELPTLSEKAKIRVAISRNETEQLILHEFVPEELTDDVLLGRINITDSGFVFYDRVEVAEEAAHALELEEQAGQKEVVAQETDDSLENIGEEFTADSFSIPFGDLQPDMGETTHLKNL